MKPRPEASGEEGEDLQLRPHTRERTKLHPLPTLPPTHHSTYQGDQNLSRRAAGETPTQTTTTRTLLDIEGAAAHLTVTVRFMRTLVAERRIRYLKVGKFVRFDVQDLDEWLDRCRVEATAE